LLLNAALFSYILLTERARDSRFDVDADARLILDPDFASAITSIHISSRNQPDAWEFLLRDANAWVVSQPMEWPASEYAMENLLFHLEHLAWGSRFAVDSLEATGQSLASYDLESPQVEIRLTTDQREQTIYLGSSTEIGDRLYLRISDSDYVHVVDGAIRRILAADMRQFMEPRMFTMERDEVRAIQIHGRTDDTVRSRITRVEDQWRFTSPIEADANNDRTMALLDRWLYAPIGQWLDDPVDPAVFAESSLRLTMESFSGPQTLLLAPLPGNEDAFMARREAFATVFTVPAHRVQQLRNAREELRERRVLHQWADRWSSLEIRTAANTITLQQLENGQWQVLSTTNDGDLESLPAEPQAIDNLNTVIASLEAVRFINEAPGSADVERYGLTEPQRRITLRSNTGDAIELTIGYNAPEATLLYATTNRSAAVFQLRPHVLAEFPVNAHHYQELTIRSRRDDEQIAQWRLSDRTTEALLLDSSMEWPAQLDSDRRQPWLEWLAAPRYDRILSLPFTTPLRVSEEREMDWRYLLEIDYRGPAESTATLRLLLTERLGGGLQYLAAEGGDVVGLLPGEWIDMLDPLLAEFPGEPTSAPPDAQQ
jgi:hypothetical protein